MLMGALLHAPCHSFVRSHMLATLVLPMLHRLPVYCLPKTLLSQSLQLWDPAVCATHHLAALFLLPLHTTITEAILSSPSLKAMLQAHPYLSIERGVEDLMKWTGRMTLVPLGETFKPCLLIFVTGVASILPILSLRYKKLLADHKLIISFSNQKILIPQVLDTRHESTVSFETTLLVRNLVDCALLIPSASFLIKCLLIKWKKLLSS